MIIIIHLLLILYIVQFKLKKAVRATYEVQCITFGSHRSI
jgi:hypothetical protein